MTMTNAEWMRKNGYKCYDLDCSVVGESEYEIYIRNTCIDTIKTDDSPLGAMLKWLDMEHVDPILDDAEKRYLSAVIKPFRQKVEYIVKFRDEKEWINIYLGIEYIHFPTFVKGTMYKGMEVNRHYTLEELGI